MVHWDQVAIRRDQWSGWGRYYHERLTQIFQLLVDPGRRVLEIGCGRGDLLNSLRPSLGVGVDFSAEMVRRAAQHHPDLQFIRADSHELDLTDKFDFIILSDLVNDLWDVQAVLQRLRCFSVPRTRLIVNFYSKVWELPILTAQKLGCSTPLLPQNWLTVPDMGNLLKLSDFDVIRHWEEILLPLPLGLLSTVANRYLVKLWPFKYFAMTNFIVAQPSHGYESGSQRASVSVVVPARNEAGNISAIFERLPSLGSETDLIFVEGHSTDETYSAIQKVALQYPERKTTLLRQNGTGKGDAVRWGFAHAQGDILMILDADLTVPPEDLERFYDALVHGKAEFVNGVRLVYPMEKRAMRFFNLLGNKFFTFMFSWLLGQPVKDTLCGTKVLWRSDYELIAANRSYFGDFDPFGDFDLLFGAAKLNLKIMDLPIRYQERTYGATNIRRWRHGWLLLQMVVFAAHKIKFV